MRFSSLSCTSHTSERTGDTHTKMERKSNQRKRKAEGESTQARKKSKKNARVLTKDDNARQDRLAEDAMKHGMFTLLLNRLPVDGPQLSTVAKKSLLKGKVTVTIMKQDPNLCMKNNLLGLWEPTMPFYRENSLSLLSSVLRRKGLDIKRDRSKISMDETVRRTAMFLSFEQHPEEWLDEDKDMCFDKNVDPFKVSLTELEQEVDQSRQPPFLDHKKCNTRYVEQDTDYHRLDGGNAIIIGDINVWCATRRRDRPGGQEFQAVQ